MDFNSLLQTAQKMQEEMEKQEKELNEKEYHNTVSRSIVEVTMTGNFQLTEIKINPDFAKDFTADDKEILEDAILLAVNELTKQIEEDKAGAFGQLTGGLNIPGLM
ncbi:MAG: YbaB/EbfC family nucleoid-associated protein [Erysipelotrichaceae bacterium]|nr:YbaB/EbfC family nucleoid-associated protein [Erysipelotrichaceae bacterium]